MGILLEADYKGVLSGKESVISGLRRAFSAKKGGSQDLSARKEGEELVAQERDGQVTYELMNRDSGEFGIGGEAVDWDCVWLDADFGGIAITLAQEASYKNVPSFVFISAAAGAPMLPQRYITTKRDAESTIASSLPKMRSIFIRPGFLYDSSRKFTLPIAFFGSAGNMVNSMLGGRLTWLAGAAVEKPLKVDLVAEAVVEAIEDQSVKGVVVTERIEELANNAWRRGML